MDEELEKKLNIAYVAGIKEGYKRAAYSLLNKAIELFKDDKNDFAIKAKEFSKDLFWEAEQIKTDDENWRK